MTPRRLSIPLAVLMVLTCASIAFFIFFGRDFPPTMAVRFNADGEPVVWMDRVKFIVLGSFLSFMLPTFVAAVIGVVPRVLPPAVVALPNKGYWLAPERRNATFDLLLWFGLWLACLLQAFLLLIDIAIYRANLTQPPALDSIFLEPGRPTVLLLSAIGVWALAVGRAFAVPRANLP